jgi:hypothetical protein
MISLILNIKDTPADSQSQFYPKIRRSIKNKLFLNIINAHEGKYLIYKYIVKRKSYHTEKSSTSTSILESFL